MILHDDIPLVLLAFSCHSRPAWYNYSNYYSWDESASWDAFYPHPYLIYRAYFVGILDESSVLVFRSFLHIHSKSVKTTHVFSVQRLVCKVYTVSTTSVFGELLCSYPSGQPLLTSSAS